MKYIGIFFIALILTGFGLYILTPKNPKSPTIPSASLPTPTASGQSDGYKLIEFQNIRYSYLYRQTTDNDDIILIPNFDSKKTSGALIESNSCKFLINGSYYTADHEPLGLFWSEASLSGKYRPNRLIDGVVARTTEGRNSISWELPDYEKYQWALQSGPVLLYDGETMPLAIKSDEPARRSVLGMTTAGDIVFITFFQPDNVYDGPLLADLPRILTKFAETENIPLKSAINLDGGSASAFISEAQTLGEFSLIGGAFCVK